MLTNLIYYCDLALLAAKLDTDKEGDAKMSEKRKGWPISERGRDLEESIAQMEAKDRMNLLNQERGRKKNEERMKRWKPKNK